MKRILLILTFLIQLSSCDCLRQTTGTVVDKSTKFPLTDAIVSLTTMNIITSTDSMGKFRLTYIQNGMKCYCKSKQELVITKNDYLTTKAKVGKDSIILDSINTFEKFKLELDNYAKILDSTTMPAPCGEYVLKYIVSTNYGQNTSSVLPELRLCEDIKEFKRVAALFSNDRWTYSFQPIGDKYYIIRGDLAVGRIVWVEYYYQRIK